MRQRVFLFLSLFVCSWLVIFASNCYADTCDSSPWCGNPGTQIGAGLPSGYEPSGIVYHKRLQKLFLVNDNGQVSRMNTDGSGVVTWPVAGNPDLEGIAVADDQTDLVYLGIEYPAKIVEFNISTGFATVNSWSLIPWMNSAHSDQGLEALTFVPNGRHPYANSSSGGLFYAGNQEDGKIYVFDVNLSQSGDVSFRGTITPVAGRTDLSDLHYEKDTDTLYAIYDTANKLVEMTTNGTVLNDYCLPGDNQEGIAFLISAVAATATIFIAEDSNGLAHNIYSYVTSLTRGPFLQLGSTTGATIVWKTDVSGDSTVEYGTTPVLGSSQTGPAGTTHVVTISALIPGTRYYYRILTNSHVLKVKPADTVYQFKTHSVLNSETNVTFAVVADFGDGSARETAVRDQIKAAAPDFILTVGDNAYSNGTAVEIQNNVFGIYQDVLHSAFYYPTFGNHDHYTSNGQPSREAYYLPANGMGASAEEYFYSFDVGDIHFVVLDSNKDLLGPAVWAAQKTWLANDLASTTRPWKIVTFHHAAYTSTTASHSYNTNTRTEIVPILETYHVDAVFQGHNHLYEQFYPIYHNAQNNTLGIKYYVTGNGGAELNPATSVAAFSKERSADAGGYLRCTYNAAARTLTIQEINQNGNPVGTSWSKTKTDPDNDGLTYIQEEALGTDPLDSDTDNDGLSDGAEVTAGTDPLDSDTDNDGYLDGQEVTAGTNPLNIASIPAVIKITSDNSYILYVNGVQVGTNSNWTDVETWYANLQVGGVLTVKAIDTGGIASLAFQICLGNDCQYSNFTCQVGTTIPAGWPAVNDPSILPGATEHYTMGQGPWGNTVTASFTDPSKVKWIWASDPNNVNTAYFYTRFDPEQNGIVKVTADNTFQYYLNGSLEDSGNTWSQVKFYPGTFHAGDMTAFYGHDISGIASFIGEISWLDSFGVKQNLYTSGNWRLSLGPYAYGDNSWTQIAYVEVGWDLSTVTASLGSAPWYTSGTLSSLSNNDKWIWGSNANTIDDVYFRQVIPNAILSMTADNTFEVYHNGKKVGRGSDWRSRQLIGLSLQSGDVIAVKAMDAGGIAGLLASLTYNNQTYVTNASWKYSLESFNDQNWTQQAFDDSLWSNAVVMGNYGMAPWGNVAGISNSSKWIWSNDAYAHDTVYFRFVVP